ncbi:uncharacterized protein LOC129578030 [Sitodiplosis mosellana]|uniref:uncharacterized protein LOC129578030 n=1 Tax=Sitodiplosis mosellana TaxID=263140 RepID=UPI002443FB45|nr:uncharacterized protein LOC129578030 [Sitodiplosis mosellana]
MESSNMFAKGTEIYMKCLIALQQHQKTPDISATTTSSSMPYYVPHYTRISTPQPLMYMPNQYPSHLGQVPNGRGPPHTADYNGSAFKPMNSWSHGPQQYAPFNSFDSQPSIKQSAMSADSRYFNQYDRNVTYGAQLPPNPVDDSVSMSMEKHGAIDSKWHSQSNMQSYVPVQPTMGYNESYSTAMNPGYAQPPMIDMKSTRSSPFQSETAYNNGHQVASKCENKHKPKKVRRPMNSFMLYAKRHRTQVHQLYPLCDNRTVSKILSETWYAMDPIKKRMYHDFAAEMREEHFRLHPHFKWKTSSEPNVTPKPTDQSCESVFAELKPVTDKTLLPSNDAAEMQLTDFGYGLKEDLMNHFPITPSTENSLSPVACVDAAEQQLNEPFAVDAKTEFRLGPTPAQLGRYRNKTINNSTTDAVSMPSNHVPDSTESNDCLNIEDNERSLATNQSQFKKRFQSLPQFDFSTYRMSNEWDASPTSPSLTYNTYSRKRAQPKPSANEPNPAKRVVGERFFGPDFNVNSFKDLDMNSFSSSPVTPSSAEDQPFQQEKVHNKKKRHLINQRKTLIMELFDKCGFFPSPKDLDDFLKEHTHLFGSKNFLNVKIREYRQKHMQNQSPQ